MIRLLIFPTCAAFNLNTSCYSDVNVHHMRSLVSNHRNAADFLVNYCKIVASKTTLKHLSIAQSVDKSVSEKSTVSTE